MPDKHLSSQFDSELNSVSARVMEMGGLVESQIRQAVYALSQFSLEAVETVASMETRINAMEVEIDSELSSIIARRQPMAADLRMVVTAIQVANDLERTGDMAKQLAKRAMQLENLGLAPKFYNGVKHMKDLVARQLQAALDAYLTRDSSAAIEVCNHDDEVDAIYNSLFRELLTYMMEDPRNITQCTHLLFCAKSLERVGDHATNIAEAAYYLETGRHLGAEAQQRQQLS